MGRRRSTVLEVRQSLAAASKKAADEAAAGDETRTGSSDPTVPEEGRQGEPPPAPFRGTFWDDDDGEPTFPARRVSYDLHSGKRYTCMHVCMYNGACVRKYLFLGGRVKLMTWEWRVLGGQRIALGLRVQSVAVKDDNRARLGAAR